MSLFIVVNVAILAIIISVFVFSVDEKGILSPELNVTYAFIIGNRMAFALNGRCTRFEKNSFVIDVLSH